MNELISRRIEAGRSAAMGDLDWGLVAGRVSLLLALVVVSATFVWNTTSTQ